MESICSCCLTLHFLQEMSQTHVINVRQKPSQGSLTVALYRWKSNPAAGRAIVCWNSTHHPNCVLPWNFKSFRKLFKIHCLPFLKQSHSSFCFCLLIMGTISIINSSLFLSQCAFLLHILSLEIIQGFDELRSCILIYLLTLKNMRMQISQAMKKQLKHRMCLCGCVYSCVSAGHALLVH